MFACVSSLWEATLTAPTAVWDVVKECRWSAVTSAARERVSTRVVVCGAVGVASTVVGSAVIMYTLCPKTFLKTVNWWSRRRSGLETKTVSARDGFSFCYATRGQRQRGLPTLVLLGGLGATIDNWVPVVKLLPDKLHIIVVEMPGSGTTSCDPTSDLHVLGQVKRLKQFLELVGLTSEPVHLVGAATGGTVAGCFAAAHTELVAKLTLICPAIRGAVESDCIKMQRAGVQHGLIPRSADDIAQSLQLISSKPRTVPKQIRKGWFELMRPSIPHMIKLFESTVDEVWMGDADSLFSASRLRDVTAPTLVIWGKLDRVTHVSGAEVLRAGLDRCVRVEILPNCGHSIYLDEPRQLAQLLCDFSFSPIRNFVH